MAPRLPRDERDRGATLILALIFIIAGGMIIAALTDLAMNDLNNTGQFAQARTLPYDASSAVEVAIQNIRYTPMVDGPNSTLTPNPPSYCWGSGPTSSITFPGANAGDPTYSITVWCSTVQVPASQATRTVTLYACPSSSTLTQCEATPLVKAVVVFDDYPYLGTGSVNLPETTTCSQFCGQGMYIESWTYNG